MASSMFITGLWGTKNGHSPSVKVSDYLLLGIYPREMLDVYL